MSYSAPQFQSAWSGIWDSFNGRSGPNDPNKRSFSQTFQNFGIPQRLQAHLFNIYSTLAIMIGLSSISAIATWNTPPHPWIWGLLNFGAMIWFAFSSPQTQFLTINLQTTLLYTIASTTGILIVPALRMAHFEAPMAIPLALISTTLVFAALTIAAFKAERASVLYYWSGISLAVGALSFYSLIIMMFGLEVLPSIFWSAISLVTTCFVVVLDTQQILAEYHQNPGAELEYKGAVLKFFWSFSKLFIKLLHIMMNLMKDDKKDNERRRREERR